LSGIFTGADIAGAACEDPSELTGVAEFWASDFTSMSLCPQLASIVIAMDDAISANFISGYLFFKVNNYLTILVFNL
jgi:hypothetical protein